MNSSQPSRGVRIDTLAGDFVIFQPEHGQRYTTDDMLAAWMPAKIIRESGIPIPRFFDLGSGLCSVPMILLWACPRLRGVGVEINRQRLSLGMHSLAANGLTQRFRLICGDLRTVSVRSAFPLITSSPPYYEAAEGLISPCAGKAAARFELNGGIEDYFRCAAGHLVRGGFFTTIYPYRHAGRVFAAAEAYGFSLERQVDIIPRCSKPKLMSVFCFRKELRGKGIVAALAVRDLNRDFTDQYRHVRREIGFPEPR